MTESDWSDRSEVAARLTAQFADALARLIAASDQEGRYDELPKVNRMAGWAWC
jgi:hypothetical protein